MPPKGKKIPRLSDVVNQPIGDAELKQVVADAKALSLPALPSGGLPPLPDLPPLGLPPMRGSSTIPAYGDPIVAINSANFENKIADMLTRQHLKDVEDAKDRHKIVTSYFEQIMKDVGMVVAMLTEKEPPFDTDEPEEKAPSADVLIVVEASKQVLDLYAKGGQPLQPQQYKSLVATGIARSIEAGKIKSADLEECYAAFTASLA